MKLVSYPTNRPVLTFVQVVLGESELRRRAVAFLTFVGLLRFDGNTMSWSWAWR